VELKTGHALFDNENVFMGDPRKERRVGVDLAWYKLPAGCQWQNAIQTDSHPGLNLKGLSAPAPVESGETLHKVGRSTGLSTGRHISTIIVRFSHNCQDIKRTADQDHYNVPSQESSKILQSQLLTHHDIRGGDSGGLLYRHHHTKPCEPVAVVHSQVETCVGVLSVSTPIEAVYQVLQKYIH